MAQLQLCDHIGAAGDLSFCSMCLDMSQRYPKPSSLVLFTFVRYNVSLCVCVCAILVQVRANFSVVIAALLYVTPWYRNVRRRLSLSAATDVCVLFDSAKT